MKSLTFRTLTPLLALCLALLVACSQAPIDNTGGTTTKVNIIGRNELPKFDSNEELIGYLNENNPRDTNTNYYGAVRSFATDDFAIAESAPSVGKVAAMGMGADGSAGSGNSYSGTNVQVSGVDEADIMKTDGDYIYLLSGETLAITKATPADDMKVITEEHIRGRPQNIFVNGDRLVVFTVDNDQKLYWPQYGIMPYPRYTSLTKALIYDISDKENIKLIEQHEISGNYLESRMIDDQVYIIVNDDVNYGISYVELPTIRTGDKVMNPEVYYFDNPENNYQYTTIAQMDLEGNIDANSYLTGYSSTVYMTENSLYVAFKQHAPYRANYDEERFKAVILPLLPANIRSSAKNADDWSDIAPELAKYYETLTDKEREELFQKIEDAAAKYDYEWQSKHDKTIIHKFAVGTTLDYQTQGEVKGTLLNQFSLDEYEGNLRVATTTSLWTNRERIQHNNVYVLDEYMKQIGELEEIAPDESIYSTRFMGDTLYMVTFEQVDPFFVIDLENPRKPEILGELKIPGWSNYLHPYDENHIIGIGKETKLDEYGRVRVQGVKLALFDVSNVNNPTQVDMVEIGDSGSNSEVLQDHKALLFDKEKELLVLPISRVNDASDYRNRRVWQGAYVYQITEDGFEEQTRISHYDGPEARWSYYGNPTSIRRSLYINDVLYTVSLEKIMTHSLDNFKELGEVEVPYEAPNSGHYYDAPEPMPVDIVW